MLNIFEVVFVYKTCKDDIVNRKVHVDVEATQHHVSFTLEITNEVLEYVEIFLIVKAIIIDDEGHGETINSIQVLGLK